ncbi:MAG: glycosyltransferase family 4 protein [Pseudoxanthomonas sp.]|nr:glycosyltransferase family 4 protein [Pseudoxanthomonas sp.]
MRVLHVTLSFANGGRREAIAALAAGLAGQGVSSSLCCLDGLDSTPAERAVFADAFALDRRKLFDLRALRRLARYCADHGIDILHAHDAASEATCALAMPFSGTPLLMSFHRTRNFESARLRDRIRNAVVGLRVGAVVTASRERRDHFIGSNWVSPAKVECIPLGIDLERFAPDPDRRAALRAELDLPDDALLVGCVGHFGPEKGVDLAIDAFQRVLAAHPDQPLHLVVLGRGDPDHERLVRARVRPQAAQRIHFAGFRTDPERWFQGFDVLLHGARHEAFGLVLAEAQACGVPVVAAAVGGIPDVVVDGATGLLAATADAEHLAASLARLLADPPARLAMAAAASRHAATAFSRDRYALNFLALYRRLLDGRR